MTVLLLMFFTFYLERIREIKKFSKALLASGPALVVSMLAFVCRENDLCIDIINISLFDYF